MHATTIPEIDQSPYMSVNSVHAGLGTPVILIHGLAASLHDWDDLLPALSPAGYAGYALDLLGHGESVKPPGLEAYNAETVFEHFRSWLDALSLDQPLVLLGHSLGGYLALRLALERPAQVRALILVNPFYSQAQLPSPLRLFFKRPLLNTAIIERTPYWLFRFLIDLSSLQFSASRGAGHTLPEKVRRQTALDYKRAAPGIFNIPRTLPDLNSDLSRIIQPALVLWGVRDQTLDPNSFRNLVGALPNARGEELTRCGHVPHQCHPTAFNQEILAFLDTL